ncbi:hypothetical protein CFC21_001870 [Triticum aestivum]|uniref:Uncharacterized protein n=1 Tax=Triticum aestivum TaxID=4565 RepID=A0A3B5Y016_WHEAT|nr:uncharacterized protein LOC123123482 [Triticum aestivum]KAF6983746.1 hypothetical protein CFC21_001870 [Triticum aestivum]
MAPDEDDDDLTSRIVCVDMQNSPVQNDPVYVLKPVVVQTARYPPQAPMNERVTGCNCEPMPRLKNRQHQSSVLETINEVHDGPAQDDDEHMDAANESDDHIECWTKIVPQDDCERELEQVFVLRPKTRCPQYPQAQEDQSSQSNDKACADTCTDNCEKARTARCSVAQKKITKMMFC